MSDIGVVHQVALYPESGLQVGNTATFILLVKPRADIGKQDSATAACGPSEIGQWSVLMWIVNQFVTRHWLSQLPYQSQDLV